MKVYIIQEGEYENRYIAGVGASLEDSVQLLKQIYKPPYIVEWQNPQTFEDHSELTGKFEAVTGYSISCIKTFEITEHEVYTQVPTDTRVTN